MPEEKKDISYYQSQPDRFIVTNNGTVQDRETGQFVTVFPEKNPYSITPERSREFAKMNKARRVLSIARGRIRAARQYYEDKGIVSLLPDPDLMSDEELLAASANADELTAYIFNLAFLKEGDKIAASGGSFRGLSEAYSKVMEVHGEEERGIVPLSGQPITTTPAGLLQLIEYLDADIKAKEAKFKAIDAEVK